MFVALIKTLLWLAILFFILMLIMIKPGSKRDVSYFKTKMYAHRGLHGNGVPENSITAFKMAREQGYGVELDVQMTRDGQLVVFHDGNLKRMTGVDGFVRDYTFAELQEFRLADSDERIPLFTDVLDVLKDTDLICEIKGDNGPKCYELCRRTMNCLLKYKGAYCVESFSPFLVRWVKKNYPQVIRGQLSCNFKEDANMNPFLKFAMKHLLVNLLSRPDFVAYRHQDTDSFGFKLCKGVYRPFLVAWTAKGKAEQLKAWGNFDSVIFETSRRNDN